MPNYLKHLYKKNIIEIIVEYNVSEFKFNSAVKRRLRDTGYEEFKLHFKNIFGDTKSTDTSKSDVKSIHENLDEMMKI